MFSETAELYDALYAWKDYQAEVALLQQLLDAAGGVSGRRLLDVGVGTGGHVPHLRQRYSVEGLDVDAGLLAVARRKHPDVVFHQGDMAGFQLGQRFDLVVCLKIARMNVSSIAGRLSVLDFHYLIATPDGVRTAHERHELGLFRRDEYLDAFQRAGLAVTFHEPGLSGRGLYLGRKS